MISRRSRRSCGFSLPLLLLVVDALVAHASAQCSTQWLPGQNVPGTDGEVYASTLWDRDGLGPLPPVLVVGGHFAVAGSVVANNIATYDPVSGVWSALGSGMSGGLWGLQVSALTTLPNGDLVAGGNFTSAGGVSAHYIARWDGTSWSPLGSGMGGTPLSNHRDVVALTTLPNGDLVAGGRFTIAGGVSANYIARWDGTSWSALGSGTSGVINALTTLPNGDVVAGGWFTTAGGVSANGIARWNGTSWSPLGSGVSLPTSFGIVHALAVLPGGELAAGGFFTIAGGIAANWIARWDGASWSALGSGIGGYPVTAYALSVLPNGDLVAAGQFTTAGGVSANNIARWDGTSWSPLGSGTNTGPYSTVRALTTLPNGDVAASGTFVTAGGVGTNNIARWDGTSWSALASGMSGRVRAFAQLPNGDLVAAGQFTTAGGVSANHIARWDGTSWSALGSGMGGGFWAGCCGGAFVIALTTLPNGDVVAGGNFTTAGGVSANYIARWDGTSWSPLGWGTDGIVAALTTLPNGDLVAGGAFWFAGGAAARNIARWDGTSWSALGSGASGYLDRVNALTTLPNGDLVAGGGFSVAGGVTANNIARWNGTSWSALGLGLNDQVSSLIALPNGDLVAGGGFSIGLNYAGIARWDGTGWSTLGSGTNGGVLALTTLPNGDLVAGGGFTTAGGVSANNIARWNGTSWSALGSATFGGFNPWASSPPVTCLAMLPNGYLLAGGDFTIVNGAVSAYLALLTTTCPATAVPFGAGCTGAGGPNVLTATTLPWTGSTLHSVCTGLAASSLAVAVYGFTPLALPMPAVHPLGQPGCTLWVADDILLQFTRGSGTMTSQLPIPSLAAIVGGVFHHQVVPIELDATGSIVALTGSNRLTLTIGAF